MKLQNGDGLDTFMAYWRRLMVMGVVFVLIASVGDCTAQSQIPSAHERMRREELNQRKHLTLQQVRANKFDLKGKVFRFKFFMNTRHDIEQIEANRYKVWLNNTANQSAGVAHAHLPRAGAQTLGDKIRQGDVVLGRIKDDEANLTIEIVGVSAVGVWE